MKYKLSILIPARNEMFLKNTVEDILAHKEGDTEIIVGLDGRWADPPLLQHPDLKVIYTSKSIGQRAITNMCAKVSRATYVCKVDAHCAFDKGFDVKMMNKMQDDWTMIPIMRNLWAFDWKCYHCGWKKYQGPTLIKCEQCGKDDKIRRKMIWKGKTNPQSTAYYFDKNLKFQYWSDWGKKQKGDITETMSAQGSCFMLTREKYFELDICDESWGSWGNQGTEVACKTILSGGRLVVNRTTWYAHMFRTQGGDFGFPYKLKGKEVERARKCSRDMFLNNKWKNQIYPLSYIIEKFSPPSWELDKLKQEESKCERTGIYSIKSLSNGRIYIGSAINISNRICEHIRKLNQKDHQNIHLQRTWDKYGKNDLVFSILYFCRIEDLIKNEQQFIDKYKDKIGWDMMFNISPTAGSTLGMKCSEETKEKISIAQTGKEAWNKGLTKETDKRVKEYANKITGIPKWEDKEHPRGMLKKEHTLETKEQISQSMQEISKDRIRNEKGQFINPSTKDI